MEQQQKYEDAGLSALFDMSFKRFITLGVIKVLYGLGIAVIALVWLTALIGALTQGGGQTIIVLVLGSLIALFYIIFYRVWLEIIVVIFRIGENTSKLVQQREQTGM